MIYTIESDSTSVLAVRDMLLARKSFSPVGTALGITYKEKVARSLQHFCAADHEEGAIVVFTSGTAGAPKGIILSPTNLEAAAKAFGLTHNLSRTDRWLLSLPLHHISGLSILLRSIFLGHEFVVSSARDMQSVARAVAKNRVTGVSFVPTQLKNLLDCEESVVASFLGCRILIGGAPLPPLLLHRAQQRGLIVHQSYGATETAAQVVNDGIPHAGVEVKCLSTGEIAARGAMVASRYLTEEGIFPVVDDQGFWHSGDLGEKDSGGRLSVTGRIKDLIISGGLKISPIEVEREILSHPYVSDVAVFGLDHVYWGQSVSAAVVCSSPLDVDELKDFLKVRLGAQKVPKSILFFQEIPRTPLGKINRPFLAEEFKLRLQSKSDADNSFPK